MTALPPPAYRHPDRDPDGDGPIVVCPRLRRAWVRFWRWCDRRRALQLASQGQSAMDQVWYRAYHDWWYATGWEEAADPPDKAFANMLAQRKRTPS